MNFDRLAIWSLTLQENKVERHKLNSSTRISTYLILEIVLGRVCIKVGTLDNTVMILSSCWLSSFQCVSSHLQIDQEGFGTQALLGHSWLVNKCFGTFTNFSTAHHNLGSSKATPSHLGGFTSKSNKYYENCFTKLKCSQRGSHATLTWWRSLVPRVPCLLDSVERNRGALHESVHSV
jgi:hypothetical protein